MSAGTRTQKNADGKESLATIHCFPVIKFSHISYLVRVLLCGDASCSIHAALDSCEQEQNQYLIILF